MAAHKGLCIYELYYYRVNTTRSSYSSKIGVQFLYALETATGLRFRNNLPPRGSCSKPPYFLAPPAIAYCQPFFGRGLGMEATPVLSTPAAPRSFICQHKGPTQMMYAVCLCT